MMTTRPNVGPSTDPRRALTLMLMKRGTLLFLAGSWVVLITAIACGSSGDDPPASPDGGVSGADGGARGIEPAGQTCSAATQCYSQFDGGAAEAGIQGTITCLDKVPNGYCTHTCTQDTECCAVAKECLTGVKQVCSPFTNQNDQYCFLSCEDDDIEKAVAANPDAGFDGGQPSSPDEYCKVFAGTATSCRSSGGGSKNRKVCIPQQ